MNAAAFICLERSTSAGVLPIEQGGVTPETNHD
jgi:hypothetical protein